MRAHSVLWDRGGKGEFYGLALKPLRWTSAPVQFHDYMRKPSVDYYDSYLKEDHEKLWLPHLLEPPSDPSDCEGEEERVFSREERVFSKGLFSCSARVFDGNWCKSLLQDPALAGDTRLQTQIEGLAREFVPLLAKMRSVSVTLLFGFR